MRFKKCLSVILLVVALMILTMPNAYAEECCSWNSGECSGSACTGSDWYWMVIVCDDGSWGYWSGNHPISLPCPE
jgi:hypothetical protein